MEKIGNAFSSEKAKIPTESGRIVKRADRLIRTIAESGHSLVFPLKIGMMGRQMIDYETLALKIFLCEQFSLHSCC